MLRHERGQTRGKRQSEVTLSLRAAICSLQHPLRQAWCGFQTGRKYLSTRARTASLLLKPANRDENRCRAGYGSLARRSSLLQTGRRAEIPFTHAAGRGAFKRAVSKPGIRRRIEQSASHELAAQYHFHPR